MSREPVVHAWEDYFAHLGKNDDYQRVIIRDGETSNPALCPLLVLKDPLSVGVNFLFIFYIPGIVSSYKFICLKK